ncbi:hypothetical protein GALL_370420 [mine drainage metagenome]|uniref:Uncharacterized protein n=1 Tax=mine drainage metagenome TaxID=410659 RepID=A0A1J5QUM6_9ZZZZ
MAAAPRLRGVRLAHVRADRCDGHAVAVDRAVQRVQRRVAEHLDVQPEVGRQPRAEGRVDQAVHAAVVAQAVGAAFERSLEQRAPRWPRQPPMRQHRFEAGQPAQPARPEAIVRGVVEAAVAPARVGAGVGAALDHRDRVRRVGPLREVRHVAVAVGRVMSAHGR